MNLTLPCLRGSSALRVFIHAFFAFCLSLVAAIPVVFAQVNPDPEIHVRTAHSPQINGLVDGSVQSNQSGNINLNSGAEITGPLYVPGSPQIKINGNATPPQVIEGQGNPSPSNKKIIINSGASVVTVVRRTDPIDLLEVVEPSAPSGTRNVNLNSSNDDPGDFATIKNLNANSNAGSVVVPAGSYGNFTANSGSTFVLGVPNTFEPSVYHFQRLNLNSNSSLELIGPVIIVLRHGSSFNSPAVGNVDHPEWLLLKIFQGGMNLNSNVDFYGHIRAPEGHVNINSQSRLFGTLESDRLNLNSNGQIIGIPYVLGPPPNDPPLANAAALATDEDIPLPIILTGTDPEGEPLTFSVIDQPIHGQFSGIAPNLTYTPNADSFEDDSLSFIVNDGVQDSSPALVSITVKPINDAPVAAPIDDSTPEDNPLSIVLSGSDIENDLLSFIVVAQPTKGTLSGTAPDLIYTPDADVFGPESFTFKVNDGALDSPLATVSIDIIPINDPPNAVPVEVELDEDTVAEVILTATDIDTTNLFFVVKTLPSNGELRLNGVVIASVPQTVQTSDLLEYAPNPDYASGDSFIYEASDGGAASEEASVSITVLPVNDAPIANADAFSTPEDTALTGQLAGSDVDGDALIFALDTPSSNGAAVVNSDGSFTYAPNPNTFGADSFTFTVFDGSATSAASAVALTVDPINDAPVANPQSVNVTEDTPTQIVLSGSDIENSPLTFAVTNPPANGSFELVGDTVTYTPNLNFDQTDSFTFLANDGELDSLPVDVSISMIPVNDLPAAGANDFTTLEDAALSGQLLATDAESDPITFAKATDPVSGTVIVNPDGSFVYTPALNAFGPDNFTFTVADPTGISAPFTANIEVSPVNDAPVAGDVSLSTDENITLNGAFPVVDVDGPTLTVEVLSNPLLGALTVDGLGFSYVPNADVSGSETINYRAFDGELFSEPKTLTIQIADVLTEIAAVDQTLDVLEDGFLPIGLTYVGEPTGSVSFAIIAPPTNGQFTGDGSSWVYRPNSDYFGGDVFTFSVTDDETTSEATVTINVVAVNDAPTISGSIASTIVNTPVNVTLAAQDVDSATFTYLIVGQPTFGSLEIQGDQAIYTPDSDYVGPDAFSVVANDGGRDSTPATIEVNAATSNVSRVYTTFDDFREGRFSGLSETGLGSLITNTASGSYSSLWVAVGGNNTVVRVEPDTGALLGQIRTVPEGSSDGVPTRTAIDLLGNLWVLNTLGGTVVKIADLEGRNWIDQNGNAVLDTSGSLGDLRPWNLAAQEASPNNVSVSEDELVVLYFDTGLERPTHLSVTPNGNVWVGGEGAPSWRLFDGETGSLIREELGTGSEGGHGGVLTPEGILYSTGRQLLRWDTAFGTDSANTFGNWPNLKSSYRYGTFVLDDDSSGNIWIAGHQGGQTLIRKVDPEGNLLGEFENPGWTLRGLHVDQYDSAWVSGAMCGQNFITRYNNDGTIIGNIIPQGNSLGLDSDYAGRIWVATTRGFLHRIDPLLGGIGADGETPKGKIDITTAFVGPNLSSYANFAGGSNSLDFGNGSWAVTYDSGVSNAKWGPVVWDALLCGGSQLEVFASVSNANTFVLAEQLLTQESSVPDGRGQYLNLVFRMRPGEEGEPVALEEVSVGTDGYASPPFKNDWDVRTEGSVSQSWPGTIPLRGYVCQFDGSGIDVSAANVTWQVLSGPGQITIADQNDTITVAEATLSGIYELSFTADINGVSKSANLALELLPVNRKPWVYAGDDIWDTDPLAVIQLQGDSKDEGLPLPLDSPITHKWTKIFGPGDAVFADDADPLTTVTVTVPGTYMLELEASDGVLSSHDEVEVRVGFSCELSDLNSKMSAWWQSNYESIDFVSNKDPIVQGDVSFEPGKVGGAFTFDGDGDRLIQFEHDGLNINGETGGTIEFWIKDNGAGAGGKILEWKDGDEIGLEAEVTFRNVSSYTIEFTWRSPGGQEFTQDVSVPFDWTHLAFAYDRVSGVVEIYRNGTLFVSDPITFDGIDALGDLYIGDGFSGLIDELTLYSEYIGEDDIQRIRLADSNGKCPPGQNQAPSVSAGQDIFLSGTAGSVTLEAAVSDDNLPNTNASIVAWEQIDGPATATISNLDNRTTDVNLPASGRYRFKITAHDGMFSSSDEISVYLVDEACETVAHPSLQFWLDDRDPFADFVSGAIPDELGNLDTPAGLVGEALDFTTGGSVRFRPNEATDLSATNEFTIEFWLKPNSNGGSFAAFWDIFSWRDAHGNRFRVGQNQRNMSIATDSIEDRFSGSPLNQGQWTHVAITYDGSAFELYSQGLLIGRRTLSGFDIDTTRGVLTIGGAYDGSSSTAGSYNGAIDELTFYSASLKPADIFKVFSAGSEGKCRDLGNEVPFVFAGQDIHAPDALVPIDLVGQATDDGIPVGSTVSISWSVISGPSGASILNSDTLSPTLVNASAGRYRIQLTVDDGILSSSDAIEVFVAQSCDLKIPDGATFWLPFNGSYEEKISGSVAERFIEMPFENGPVGEALFFQGNTAGFAYDPSPAVNIASGGAFSIEFWAQPPSLDHRQILRWEADGVNPFSIGISNQRFRIEAGGSIRDFGSNVSHFNSFDHFVLTYSGGLFTLYKNGVFNSATTLALPQAATEGRFYVGRSEQNGVNLSPLYGGRLDELTLYNRALSGAEAAALRGAGSSGKCPDVLSRPLSLELPADFFEPMAGNDIQLMATVGGGNSNRPVQYLWEQISGPAAVLNDEDSLTASLSSAPIGIITLKFTASDGVDSISDTVSVYVDTECDSIVSRGLSLLLKGENNLNDELAGDSQAASSGHGYEPGIVGDAFTFPGLGGGFGFGPSASTDVGGADGFAMEFWIKSPDTSRRTVFGWADPSGNVLDIEKTSNELTLVYNGASINLAARGGLFPSNVWKHVALSFSGSTVSLFVNGVFEETEALLLPTTITSGDFFVGRSARPISTSPTDYFDGSLDEISLYNRTLTVLEAARLFSSGSQGKCLVPHELVPFVDAGPDVFVVNANEAFVLDGFASDDDLPKPLTVVWTQLRGPEILVVDDPDLEVTSVSGGLEGLYLFELSASDGVSSATDTVWVQVGASGCESSLSSQLQLWLPFENTLDEVINSAETVGFGNLQYTARDDQSSLEISTGAARSLTIEAGEGTDIASDGEFTIEFMAKPDSGPHSMALFAWQGLNLHFFGNRFGVSTSSTHLQFGNGGIRADGIWRHYVVTYKDGDFVTYRNGVLEPGVWSATVPTDATLGALNIGGSRDARGIALTQYSGGLDEIAFYDKALTPGEVTAAYNARNTGKCPTFANTNPFVDAGQDQLIVYPLAGGTVSANLDGIVLDDGLPSGSLTQVWSQPLGQTATINDPNALDTLVEFNAAGTYQFDLTGNDGDQAVGDSVTIFVDPVPNTAPVADAGSDDAAFTGVPYPLFGSASDDGLPGASLSYFWTLSSGPAGVAINDPTRSDATVAFSVPGNYELRLEASDSELSGFDTVAIVVTEAPPAVNFPPVVGAGDDRQVFLDGQYRLGGSASDDNLPNGFLSTSWQAVSGPGVASITTISGQFFVSFSEVGAYVLEFEADDGVLKTADQITFTVVDGTSFGLTAPLDGDFITSRSTVTGSVIVDGLTGYELRFREANDAGALWRTLAAGSSEIDNAAIGSIDPTLLENGLYELQLTANDDLGRALATELISFIVDEGLKVGQLSLAFEDLNVPVSGVPMQIVRSYDSRDLSQGDFGTGWQLALSNMRIQKNRPVGQDWNVLQEVVNLPIIGETLQYRITSDRSNIVALRLPDDTVQVFKAVVSPEVSRFVPNRAPVVTYEALGDTLGTLEISGDNSAWISGIGSGLDMESEAFAFDLFDPKTFKYTSIEGTEFIIDEDLGLVSLTDRNGNSITIDEDGITHSSGRGIAFIRDGAGRITSIRDPEDQLLLYTYDTEGRLETFTNRASETFTFLYENLSFPNYLTDILDPDSRSVLDSSFDAEGRLASQTDANGESFDFIHDIANFKETVVDRVGVATVHTYDLEGDVTRTEVFDANSVLVQTTNFEYDARGNETKVTDSLGNVTTRTYNDRDELLTETQTVTNAFGAAVSSTTTYAYDSFGNPLSIEDAQGQITSFAYDPSGNLLTQTDADLNVTTFAYDPRGNLKSIVDPLGNRTSFTTDLYGNQSSSAETDAAGSILQYQTFEYDDIGRQTRVNDFDIPEGATSISQATLYRYSEFDYDGEGRQTANRVYDAGGILLTSSATTYDSRGLVETQTDALGRYTVFEYDDNGNRMKSSLFDTDDSLIRSESWTYDAEGRQQAQTDPLGRVTEFAYDALGRQETVRFIGLVDGSGADLDPADTTETHTVYDEIGRVTATVDERSNTTLFEYDDECGCSGRRAKTIDALANETVFAYDLNGNQLSVLDANTHQTSFEYDDLNRPTRTIFHDGTFTQTVYDPLGRRVATIDQNGLRTDFRYDGLGRLIEVIQPSPNPGDPRPKTQYRYDSRGNQISQIDAEGRETKYEYDALGRRTKRILPELEEETYQYDAAGNLIAKVDFNGYTTTFEHDAQNRLVKETADPSHPSLVLDHAPATIEHSYDDVGNRTQSLVRNASDQLLHTIDQTHDERNRVATKVAPEGTLSYGYDAAGNLTSASSSTVGGLSNLYTYDVLNRLATVNDNREPFALSMTSYGYDEVGNLDTVDYGNDVRHDYTYDTLNRLTNLVVDQTNGGTVASYDYILGDAGNRQSVTEATGRATNYAYDDLYRLTRESISGDPLGLDGVLDYSFDQVGNRLSRSSSLSGVAGQNFTYSDNDLLNTDGYDANGNTILSEDPTASGSSVSDTYDYRNRLIRRVKADGTTIDLIYDASGNRIGKTVNTSSLSLTTSYLVDENNHTGFAQVSEQFLNGSLEARYVYGHDLIAQDRLQDDPLNPGSEIFTLSFYLYDGHGTVRQLVDEAGALQNEYVYDAFGILLSVNGQTRNAYLYTGEQFDEDLGMYFLRARYLNTQTGRLHNMDTYEGRSGEPLTLHKYLYAHANPVMGIDPSGNVTIRRLAFVAITIKLLARLARPALNQFKKAFTNKVVTIHSARVKNDRLVNPRNSDDVIDGTYHCYIAARRIKKPSKAVRYDTLPVFNQLLDVAFGDRSKTIEGAVVRRPVSWSSVSDDVNGTVARLSKGQWRLWEGWTLASSFVPNAAGEGQVKFNYNLKRNNCRHWVSRAKRNARIIQLLPLK